MLWRWNVGACCMCMCLAGAHLAIAGNEANLSDAGASSPDQVRVRLYNDRVELLDVVRVDTEQAVYRASRGVDCCTVPPGFDIADYVWDGQEAPEGGTMAPAAYMNTVTINDWGVIAFMADVDDNDRNQGIFISDGTDITPIVIGCGGGGGSGNPGDGSGDASPIGGTFSNFFSGTPYAPVINNSGNVLFLAEVDSGSSTRGLFLYKAATDEFVKVAAIGDTAPTGGTFTEIGPGSMNNNDEIAFAAKESENSNVNIYKWVDGVVTTVVAIGDSVPEGGTFYQLVTESFGYSDGTYIPTGPIPGINDAGQISFSARTTDGIATRGLFVTNGESYEWYASTADETPLGGTFERFYAPMINNSGELAFYARVTLESGSTSGWFAGSPTAGYRKVLSFDDVIEGADAGSMSVSRNPMRAIDDCGNVLVYTMLDYGDEVYCDALVLCSPDGDQMVIAKEGDAANAGGTLGFHNGWPAMNNFRQGVLSTYNYSSPDGRSDTHYICTGWLTADLDSDNDVDLSDLAELLSNYGETSGMTYFDGDLDGDEDVDLSDLAELLAAYGTDCN